MSNSEPVTTSPTCYRLECETSPKWGVASSVEQKNPDGTDLTLYTCDGHYSKLTTDLKRAGTRYTLFPVGINHMVQPEEVEAVDPRPPSPEQPTTKVGKFFFNVGCIIIVVVISPFILTYWGVRWLFGFRPPSQGQQ